MMTLTNNEDSNETGKQRINPKSAVKNMKWIVFSIVSISVIISFVVQLSVTDDNDLRNSTSLAVEIIFGIFIALVVYIYSKKMDLENKELQTKTQKQIEKAVEKTSKEIVQKVVDIANAQLRVGVDGKIAFRDGKVGADLIKVINEPVNKDYVSDESSVPSKDSKPNAENTIKNNSNSYIVSEQKLRLSADLVLVNSPQKELENIRQEIDNLKSDYKEYLQKKPKKIAKNTTKKIKLMKQKKKN